MQYVGNFRGMNDLPRVATRQRGGREANPRPVDCKSSALTTTLPRHMHLFTNLSRDSGSITIWDLAPRSDPIHAHRRYRTATDFYSNLLSMYMFHSFFKLILTTEWSVAQRADERHGNPPQGNHELLVVRDKVERPQVSLE